MTTNARVDVQPPTAPAAAPFRDLWRVIDVIFRVDRSITLHTLSKRRRADDGHGDGHGDGNTGYAGAAGGALERRRCR